MCQREEIHLFNWIISRDCHKYFKRLRCRWNTNGKSEELHRESKKSIRNWSLVCENHVKRNYYNLLKQSLLWAKELKRLIPKEDIQKTNSSTEVFPTLLIIGKRQIQTIMNYHFETLVVVSIKTKSIEWPLLKGM